MAPCHWSVFIYSQKQAEEVQKKKRPKFPVLYCGLHKQFLKEEGNANSSSLLSCCLQMKPALLDSALWCWMREVCKSRLCFASCPLLGSANRGRWRKTDWRRDFLLASNIFPASVSVTMSTPFSFAVVWFLYVAALNLVYSNGAQRQQAPQEMSGSQPRRPSSELRDPSTNQRSEFLLVGIPLPNSQ